MRRLRAVYYHNPRASISHGRVRDILHGHVDQRYRSYYDQVLVTERAIAELCATLPATVAGNDILFKTQLLGEKLVTLVDELQSIEKQLKRSRQGVASMTVALKQRQRSIKTRLEDGLQQQSQIPPRLQTLQRVQPDRDMADLTVEIERLTLFVSDVAKTYDEMRTDDVMKRWESNDDA